MNNNEKYGDILISDCNLTHGKEVTIQLRFPDGKYLEDIKLHLTYLGNTIQTKEVAFVRKENNISVYQVSFMLNNYGIYHFYFSMKADGSDYYFYNNIYSDNQFTNVPPDSFNDNMYYCWSLSVSKLDSKPEFWLGRTAYQIFVDRYCHSNNKHTMIPGRIMKSWDDTVPNWQPNSEGIYKNDYFYGGNIKGIVSKLSYIKQLGFDIIYLTPIFESSSYHHYDVRNHLKIDQYIGSWNDFEFLCQEAKKLDIAIIVDLVFNHTGIDSDYLKDPIKKHSFYEYDENGSLSFWYGFKDLPQCNKLDKDYQNAMVNVCEEFLKCGADGFRFDLGEILPKEFLLSINCLKKQYPNLIIINEMWDIATNKQNPQIFDGQADSVMNYPFADCILRWARYGNFEHFLYNFKRISSEYPERSLNLSLNNVGTHDTPTTLTMLGGDKMICNVFDGFIWDIEHNFKSNGIFDTYKFRQFEAKHDKLSPGQYIYAKLLLKLSACILYTLPGIPCIYAGTEAGIQGYKDPFNRKPYPWGNEDEELISFFIQLNTYRNSNKDILAEGKSKILYIDEHILVLNRYTDFAELVLIINRTNVYKDIQCFENFTKYKKVLLSDNESTITTIKPYGYLIIRS